MGPTWLCTQLKHLTPKKKKKKNPQLQNHSIFLISWMTTRAGPEVGKWSPRKDRQQCTSLTSVGAGIWSQRQTSVLRVIPTFLPQRMGRSRVSTLFSSSLDSLLNKQTYWEGFFFSVLKETFTELKGNQNSNLEMKTEQCDGLDEWAIRVREQLPAGPRHRPLGQLQPEQSLSVRLIFPN